MADQKITDKSKKDETGIITTEKGLATLALAAYNQKHGTAIICGSDGDEEDWGMDNYVSTPKSEASGLENVAQWEREREHMRAVREAAALKDNTDQESSDHTSSPNQIEPM